MKVKKKICGLAAATVLCTLCAANVQAMTITANDTKITVEGNGVAGENAVMIVVPENGSIDNDSDILAARQVKAGENGIARFEFVVPDNKNGNSTDGKYVVHLRIGTANAETGSFMYAPPSFRNEAMNTGIRGGAGVYNSLEKSEWYYAFGVMGVEMELYGKIDPQNRQNVLAYAENEINLTDDTDEVIIRKINTAIVIGLLNENKASATDLEGIGLTFDGTAYDSIQDSEKKNWLFDYMKNNAQYVSAQTFENAYKQANALYAVNSARFDGMQSTIASYAQILGIDNSAEYLAYSAVSANVSVNETLVSLLKQTPATSADILKSALSTAAGAAVNLGGGGSGGSSGGGSSSGISAPAVPNNEASVSIAFGDIGGYAWAEEAITKLKSEEIVSGDEKGNFNPGNFVKREEFVKMMVCALKLHDKSASCSFEDVSEDAWYYSYVASAYKSKITSGKGKTFGIGENITREDMAVMCYRVMNSDKADIREFTGFADSGDISDYAVEAVEALYKKGIISGTDNGLFEPKASATRAQAAVMIYSLIK